METHKCQDMDHHLLDPIDPDSECRHSNMKSTIDNSVRSSANFTMDHNNNEQNHRHSNRESVVTFQIRPKRKIRGFISSAGDRIGPSGSCNRFEYVKNPTQLLPRL